ncbi:hypothetical protein SAMN04489867_3196 [Pedococcus dokdonensis]|uniref:Uncharacterized protein n=2 Tax=Pedococcus TaxID=2805645 RepID=A0A1H0U910_9MICO|nr:MULTISPECIES: hypothetical protein [Pedococcus]TPG16847.1 hypothetical protein EAH86_08600 [Pedococcus bigeumensis]SDP62631.1 hypothetical protein SAMN04489867_3196 [Pedococcus dokdonensis]
MCRPATCKVCGKTTWAGCGQHVDQVMASVPRSDRCPGHSAQEQAAAGGGSFLSRLFGRN